jgi:hypothetical protein
VKQQSLSAGGNPQDFQPVAFREARLRPLLTTKGHAVVLDEECRSGNCESLYEFSDGGDVVIFRFSIDP